MVDITPKECGCTNRNQDPKQHPHGVCGMSVGHPLLNVGSEKVQAFSGDDEYEEQNAPCN
jgi:hypothetical protein